MREDSHGIFKETFSVRLRLRGSAGHITGDQRHLQVVSLCSRSVHRGEVRAFGSYRRLLWTPAVSSRPREFHVWSFFAGFYSRLRKRTAAFWHRGMAAGPVVLQLSIRRRSDSAHGGLCSLPL